MRVRPTRRMFVLSSLGLAAGALALPAARAEEKAEKQLKMGMLPGMFRDVQPAMVQALSKPFRELVQKQTGFTGDVELCAGPLDLADKLRDKKLHLGVFHGFEFAWAQQVCPELEPIVVTMPLGSKVQAMVVVGPDSKHRTLADLGDEPVTVPKGAKAHALAYLEKARAALPKGCAKPTAKASMTAEEALGAVAAGEQTAALIDAAALEGFHVLQPGVAKSLKVLNQSEPFPPAVVAYRKGVLTDDEARRIRDGLASAHQTTSGKMLMMLWNLKGFEVPPADYQQRLDTILKAYPVPTR